VTELGKEARRLIDLVRSADEPALADQRRVAQGVAASVGVLASSLAEAGSVAATLAVPAARATTVGLLVKALSASALGLGLGFAVAVPAALVTSGPAETVPTVAVPAAPAPAPAPVVQQSPGEPASAGAREPEPTPRARSRVAEAAGDGALAREIALLAAVQGELRKGQGQRALELLDEHEREGKASTLGPERAAARVLALCAVGDARAARRAADAFLNTSPDSPVVPRIRRSCAFADHGIPGRAPLR
jgi:hypothetical protein